jgi:hypothetical protein
MHPQSCQRKLTVPVKGGARQTRGATEHGFFALRLCNEFVLNDVEAAQSCHTEDDSA